MKVYKNGMCLQECFVQGSVEQMMATIRRLQEEIKFLRRNGAEAEKRPAAAEQVICIKSNNFVSVTLAINTKRYMSSAVLWILIGFYPYRFGGIRFRILNFLFPT